MRKYYIEGSPFLPEGVTLLSIEVSSDGTELSGPMKRGYMRQEITEEEHARATKAFAKMPQGVAGPIADGVSLADLGQYLDEMVATGGAPRALPAGMKKADKDAVLAFFEEALDKYAPIMDREDTAALWALNNASAEELAAGGIWDEARGGDGGNLGGIADLPRKKALLARTNHVANGLMVVARTEASIVKDIVYVRDMYGPFELV